MESRGRGRPRSIFKESSAPTLQALDRALQVLGHLARSEARTLTDISGALDIPAPTTHRILTTLQNRGFAAFDEGTQTWAVGIEAYRTGSAYLRRTTLLDAARPIMRRLMEATGETANLAVPDGIDVVSVGQVETPNPIRAFFNPGTRTAMHASGTGKAILSALSVDQRARLLSRMELYAFTEKTLNHRPLLEGDLEDTRARGWSLEREERHLGMSCIGAAITDARQEVVGAVSISGPSARFTDERLLAFGAEVAKAAREISIAIGDHSSTD